MFSALSTTGSLVLVTCNSIISLVSVCVERIVFVSRTSKDTSPFLHFFLSIHFFCSSSTCTDEVQVAPGHCRVYGSIPLRLLSTCQKRPLAWTWSIKASALHHSFSAIKVWGGEKVANWNKLWILALWTQPVSMLISATKEIEEVQNSLACEHDINVHVKKSVINKTNPTVCSLWTQLCLK